MVFVMNKRKNIIMILDKDDKMHEWILFDFARRKKLPMRTVLVDKKVLSTMRYMSIIDRQELVYIEDEDRNISVSIEDIKRINLRKRVLAISAQTKESVDRIKKAFKDERIVEFPNLKDYKDRQKQVIKIVDRWGVQCRTQEVKKSLVRSMVQDVMSWEDVKMIWDVYSYHGMQIDESALEEIFPDDEFHNLTQYIFGILKGSWKQKGVKTGHYFLEVRDYSASWLIRKIQEVYNDIGLFYQAYRGGVVLIPESKSRIDERVKGLNWDNGLRLVEFSEVDQEKYLDLVKEMPYEHYVEIAPHVLGLTERGSKEDVYEMVEKIKEVRRGTGYEWGKPRDYRRR